MTPKNTEDERFFFQKFLTYVTDNFQRFIVILRLLHVSLVFHRV